MSKVITSTQNQRIKDTMKLRGRRGRKKQRRIVIDGALELLRAMQAGVQPLEIFYSADHSESESRRKVLALADQRGLEVTEVSTDVYARIGYGRRDEGVLGVASTPVRRLEGIELSDNPLIIVLEAVEKPGNIGAVVRSADGAGAAAVIVANSRTDLFNPNAIRASLGTIFTLPVCSAFSKETLEWLQSYPIRICTARVDEGTSYIKQDFTGPTAIILGNESTGLSKLWHSSSIHPIHLPMYGVADSLNVSAAAAAILYEARRQRNSFVAL